MHEHAGGLGLRQWYRYAHTGFVGMWSLSWQSCMTPVCGGSNTLMPAYPALGEIIEQADWIAKPTPKAPMVVRIVVLEIPSQVPDQGIVRPQDSAERPWFKVSRFCYTLMKYSCDRRQVQ